jgi:hypothetical protein
MRGVGLLGPCCAGAPADSRGFDEARGRCRWLSVDLSVERAGRFEPGGPVVGTDGGDGAGGESTDGIALVLGGDDGDIFRDAHAAGEERFCHCVGAHGAWLIESAGMGKGGKCCSHCGGSRCAAGRGRRQRVNGETEFSRCGGEGIRTGRLACGFCSAASDHGYAEGGKLSGRHGGAPVVVGGNRRKSASGCEMDHRFRDCAQPWRQRLWIRDVDEAPVRLDGPAENVRARGVAGIKPQTVLEAVRGCSVHDSGAEGCADHGHGCFALHCCRDQAAAAAGSVSVLAD